MYQSLVRHKVSYAVDEAAQKLRDQVAGDLAGKTDRVDFRAIAAQYKKRGQAIDFGASGTVARSNRDGGLSQAAVKLQRNQISPAVESTSGDGYYFIQLLSIDQKRLSYQYLRVPLVKFDSMLNDIKQQGKVQEYITLSRDNQQKQ